LKTTDSDLSSKFDCNKPVGKAIKFIESYLNNSHLHKAEKLHANVKANKSEFLRLLALYPKVNILMNEKFVAHEM